MYISPNIFSSSPNASRRCILRTAPLIRYRCPSRAGQLSGTPVRTNCRLARSQGARVWAAELLTSESLKAYVKTARTVYRNRCFFFFRRSLSFNNPRTAGRRISTPWVFFHRKNGGARRSNIQQYRFDMHCTYFPKIWTMHGKARSCCDLTFKHIFRSLATRRVTVIDGRRWNSYKIV